MKEGSRSGRDERGKYDDPYGEKDHSETGVGHSADQGRAGDLEPGLAGEFHIPQSYQQIIPEKQKDGGY